MIKTAEVNMGCMPIISWLVEAGMASSRADAKRKLSQGSVYCYSGGRKERCTSDDDIGHNDVVKCGRDWMRAKFPDSPVLTVQVCDFEAREEEKHWLETETTFNKAQIERHLKRDWDEE